MTGGAIGIQVRQILALRCISLYQVRLYQVSIPYAVSRLEEISCQRQPLNNQFMQTNLLTPITTLTPRTPRTLFPKRNFSTSG